MTSTTKAFLKAVAVTGVLFSCAKLARWYTQLRVERVDDFIPVYDVKGDLIGVTHPAIVPPQNIKESS